MRTIPRKKAIEDLRTRFLEMVDDDHCICEVAAREGIFCGGFAQWSFRDLREHYGWMLRSRPRITRTELEDLANRWQLARQFVLDLPMACDVQLHEKHHATCAGWDTFSNEDLARYYRDVLDRQVEVVEDPVPENATG